MFGMTWPVLARRSVPARPCHISGIVFFGCAAIFATKSSNERCFKRIYTTLQNHCKSDRLGFLTQEPKLWVLNARTLRPQGSSGELKSGLQTSDQLDALLTEGREAQVKKRARVSSATQAQLPVPSRVVPIAVASGSDAHAKLTASFVRNLGVMCHIPVSGSRPTGIAWQAFLRDLAHLTGAKLVWGGPPSSTCQNVLAKDFDLQWETLRSELAQRRSDLEGVLCHDGWEDPWKKTIVGCVISYLNPEGHGNFEISLSHGPRHFSSLSP